MKKSKILGIELGSTRIKSVLINENAEVLASGSYEWENVLTDGLWSYSLDSVWEGLATSYKELASSYSKKYGEELTEIDSLGISAMMHGYLAFDEDDRLLVPFRTWRNTNTEEAANELSELFSFNVPQRWSVSHYYQAVKSGESHVSSVAFLTTLSGYVHYRLTGKKVLGMGDASGMFPLHDGNYDEKMLKKLDLRLKEQGIDKSFESLLPTVLSAGEEAGRLTEEGARLLDPTGKLKAGALLCPPEGDAGTGMVATNSVTPRSANVSAGTSAFLMAVLERELSSYYPEIDVVTTPDGAPVAMVHVNNFTSEINAWTGLFEEVIALSGGSMSRGELFDALYKKSLDGAPGCGGLVGYNFLAGEPIAGVKNGLPTVARIPGNPLTLGSFMKMQIYSALGSLSMGMKILDKENVEIDSVCGHGGFFKCPRVGQIAMSSALNAPVTVMQNAGEGGAWGVAILALYALDNSESLSSFLDSLFASAEKITLEASDAEKQDFRAFLDLYVKGLPAEKFASDTIL